MLTKAKIILNQKGKKRIDRNKAMKAMIRSIIVLYYTLKIKIQTLENFVPYETKNKKDNNDQNRVKDKLVIEII